MHTRAFLATQENYNKGRLPHPRALCVPILRAIVENLNRQLKMATFEPLIRHKGCAQKIEKEVKHSIRVGTTPACVCSRNSTRYHVTNEILPDRGHFSASGHLLR